MCDFPLLLAFPLGGCLPAVIISVEFVTNSLIKVNFNQDIITNEAFYDINNYSSVIEGTSSTDVTFKSVVPVYAVANDPSPTSNYALVRTSAFTPGTSYTFTVDNLVSRFGDIMESSTATVRCLPTKTDAAITMIPNHFDKRPDSVIFNVLAAITRSDELIGGSFAYPREFTA